VRCRSASAKAFHIKYHKTDCIYSGNLHVMLVFIGVVQIYTMLFSKLLS